MTDKEKLIADISVFIDKYYASELLGSARAEAFNTINDAHDYSSFPQVLEKKSKKSFEEDWLQDHKPAERSCRMSKADLVPCAPRFEKDIDFLISRREETFSKRLLRMMQEKGLDEAETYKKEAVQWPDLRTIRSAVSMEC